MNVRNLAFESIKKIIVDQGYSNLVVANTIRKYDLSPQDRRFYTELVYGVTRQQNYLQWLVEKLSKKGMKIQTTCRIILYLGLYQLFCLDSVPPSAACNESVKLAKKQGNPGMAKFVNAILRASIRQKESLIIPTKEEDEMLHLSLTYCQPKWLIARWLKDYGFETTEQLCQYFNERAPLCVRVNTRKTTVEALIPELEAKGMTVHRGHYAANALYIEHTPALDTWQELAEGKVQIQEEVSMLAVEALAPQEGETVIDLCAAPGGKTTHIATLMNDKGKVYAFDLHDHKVGLIKDNARRLGLTCIEAKQGDGTVFSKDLIEKADKVLVDAPCSGLGTLRKKPDLRWRRGEEELKTFPPLQQAILHQAAQYVKPGGTLVYSTCTIGKEENEEVVTAFLKNHEEYELEDISTLWPNVQSEEKMIQFLPSIHQTDGFFIARLHKKSRENV